MMFGNLEGSKSNICVKQITEYIVSLNIISIVGLIIYFQSYILSDLWQTFIRNFIELEIHF